MMSGREGCFVNGVRRGVPALIAFGQVGAGEGSKFEHADLFERIIRQREQPFSRLYLHDPAGTGFYRGVSWLRGTIDEVVASLRSLFAELGRAKSSRLAKGSGGMPHSSMAPCSARPESWRSSPPLTSSRTSWRCTMTDAGSAR